AQRPISLHPPDPTTGSDVGGVFGTNGTVGAPTVPAPPGAPVGPVAAAVAGALGARAGGTGPLRSAPPGGGASAFAASVPSAVATSPASAPSAGGASSALASSLRTKPATSTVAESVRGPFAPGAAPRRLPSTIGTASWWAYSSPETSSANGFSSPDSVSRTDTLREGWRASSFITSVLSTASSSSA